MSKHRDGDGEPRRHWLKAVLRAYSASAAITLGALNAGAPPLNLSRRTVLERTLEERDPNRFDPREVVARRVIITVPLDDPTRPGNGDFPGFVPN
jgi:hypothetical protein